jgi:phage baseplate assembly protein W
MAQRRDFRFPLQVATGARRVAEEEYERHIAQMIHQVILTAPGERVNLPEFGCGLRQLLFAPNSDVLATTTQFLIFQALDRWLGDVITNIQVNVQAEEETLSVVVRYVVLRTQTGQQTTVTVSV